MFQRAFFCFALNTLKIEVSVYHLIVTYTGDGKGKTSAAIGAAIRAIGANQKVLFVNFLKGRESHEFSVFKELKEKGLLHKSFGIPDFVSENNFEEHREQVMEGIKFVLDNKEGYDMIVLDEINVACALGVINPKDAISLIESLNCPSKVIIATGRGAPKELEEISDMVSRIQEVKHPYTKGEGARLGLDF